MSIAGPATVISFLAFLPTIILYVVALFGSTTTSGPFADIFIADLFTSGSYPVHLGLGYVGACISFPAGAETSTFSTQQATPSRCTSIFSVPTGTRPDDTADQFIAAMKLTRPPTQQYKASVAALIQTAAQLQKTAFAGPLLETIAACLLLGLGGLTLLACWAHASCARKRGKGCSRIGLGLAALLLGFGLMAGGASALSLLRLQDLATVDGGVAAAVQDPVVFVKEGQFLRRLIIGAFAVTCVLVVAATVAAAARTSPGCVMCPDTGGRVERVTLVGWAGNRFNFKPKSKPYYGDKAHQRYRAQSRRVR